jgi:hypothetical protein
MSNTPTLSDTNKERLSQLLDRLFKLESVGAEKGGHKDHEEREIVLDEMQKMLGLGMVLERDIVSKAKKAVGRA